MSRSVHPATSDERHPTWPLDALYTFDLMALVQPYVSLSS